MNTESPSTLIALAGGSGAGKTWLANRLCQEFGAEATLLSLDDFYFDLSHLMLSEREHINFDHPDMIEWALFESVLRELQKGGTVLTPRYDFASHTRLAGWTSCRPRPFIFVEGLWPLRSPLVRELFALRVFLDCSETLRWQRRLARDVTGRSRTTESICNQFWNVVAPMHERFVEDQKAWADLVIEQPISQSELERLIATIGDLRCEPCPPSGAFNGSRATLPPVAVLQSL